MLNEGEEGQSPHHAPITPLSRPPQASVMPPICAANPSKPDGALLDTKKPIHVL